MSDFELKQKFSDSSLREEMEDVLFRQIMAAYCENESKKILNDLHNVNDSNYINASAINKLFSKLKRQRNWHNTFRMAKKIIDRVAMLVLAAVIVFTSAVTASADVRSSLANFTSRWSTFSNIAEEPFDLDGKDVKSFETNYSVGWNFDKNESQKIYREDQLFGGTVVEAYSKYYIRYSSEENSNDYVICSENSYNIEYDENSSSIKGILCKDLDENVVFLSVL